MAALDVDVDDDPAQAQALISDLADADEALERARSRVRAVGEDELRDLAEAYAELTDLFDRYEEQVTGDGNFETFIEFQGKIEQFTEALADDLRHREVFEDVDDLLQQRRLTESDWARVRDRLEPVREDLARLDDRDDARERYHDARVAVERARSTLDDRIAELERLQRLGEADLDAPTDRLRDPIETYNEQVRETFRTARSDASAREMLAWVATTGSYPLVDYRQPPDDLQAFVETHEVGTEPIPQLLEYADYSRSKLDHYVADPDALKRAVATQQTYFRRLDASPLTVDWPPPSVETLRYRTRELLSVVGRLARLVDDKGGHGTDGASDGAVAGAEDDVLVAIRAVRELPFETDYERLRESAQARDQLGEDERRRLADGSVADELARCRSARDDLDAALDAHEPL